jgi:hypothetical protein
MHGVSALTSRPPSVHLLVSWPRGKVVRPVSREGPTCGDDHPSRSTDLSLGSAARLWARPTDRLLGLAPGPWAAEGLSGRLVAPAGTGPGVQRVAPSRAAPAEGPRMESCFITMLTSGMCLDEPSIDEKPARTSKESQRPPDVPIGSHCYTGANVARWKPSRPALDRSNQHSRRGITHGGCVRRLQ